MSPLYAELWALYSRHEKQVFTGVFGRYQTVASRKEMSNKEAVAFFTADLRSSFDGDLRPVTERLREPIPTGLLDLREYRVDGWES
jgi:hypothetical protein